MTIAEPIQRGKELLGHIPADILIVAVVILCSTLAFGLGIIVGKELEQDHKAEGFWIEQLPENTLQKGGGPAAVGAATPEESVVPVAQVYMASKTGTKYYLPTCSSAKRIKEANRIWFATKEAAEAAGYTPATNCPGL